MKENEIDVKHIDVKEFSGDTSHQQQHVEKKSELFRKNNEVIEEYIESSTLAREKAAAIELAELKHMLKKR